MKKKIVEGGKLQQMNLGNLKQINISGSKRINDLGFIAKIDLIGIHNLSGFSPRKAMRKRLIESLGASAQKS